MTLISTLPSRDGVTNNFVRFLKLNNNFVPLQGNTEEKKVKTELSERLHAFRILTVADFKIIPADKILQSKRYEIKLKLTAEYSNSFVLLRGLLEFSRPKAIRLVANTNERTFQFEISESQRDYFNSYLETIVGWLIKEIKFKETLRVIINFEEKVRKQQAVLYANAMACFT